MPHPLDSFFAPESIALIGASRDLEKIPGRLLSMLRKNEYPGKIYPINPNYGDIDGLKCYPSIADVGQPIDLAIVIIPAQSRARRAGAMRRRRRQERGDHLVGLCGGGRRQRRDAGRHRGAGEEDRHADFRPQRRRFYQRGAEGRGDLQPDRRRQAGPRCRWSRPSAGSASSRNPAASALRSSIAPRRLAWRSATCVSAGNESDLGAGEFLDYMVQDASTDVILLFIEGIRDVDKFLAAANRAAEIGKPVIVTKVGRSGAGERAAASHTASMAGWSAAYDAVFAKYGFIVSNDLDEAVTIAAVLDQQSAAEGRPRRGAHRVRRRRHLGRGRGVDAGFAGAGTVGDRSRRDQEADAVLWRGRQSDRRHRPGRALRRPADGASICSMHPTRSMPSSWCCRCRARRGCRSRRPS